MMPAQTIPQMQMQMPTSGPAPAPLPGGGRVPQNLPFVNPNTINPMDGSLQLPQTSYNVPISGSNPENIVKRGGGLGQFNPFNIPTIQY